MRCTALVARAGEDSCLSLRLSRPCRKELGPSYRYNHRKNPRYCTPPPNRDYAVLSTFYTEPVLRKGKWVISFFLGSGEQYRKNTEPEPGSPKGQLYDLETDPGQFHNLWLEYPEFVGELTELYQAHVARGSSFGIDR